MMRLLKIIIVALCVWGAIDGWHIGEIVRAPGPIAPDAPPQRPIQSGAAFTHANHTLTRRARFDVRARVLSGERYRMDTGAALMPRDIAFGWGRVSDTGPLVDVRAPSGWSINTSLSRDDTGAGACEVVYVETFDLQ